MEGSHSNHISSSNLLALPAELRLQIMSYVFFHPSNILFIPHAQARRGPQRGTDETTEASSCLILDTTYTSSANLSILAVCRQFHHEFTGLAYRETIFLMNNPRHMSEKISKPLKEQHLKNLRRVACVVVEEQLKEITLWTKYPFNTEILQLNQLTIICHSHQTHEFSKVTINIVKFLRRLQNVDVLGFVGNGASFVGSFRAWYNKLIGLILKEDHYQRYDAPGGPHLETTWWEWNYNETETSFLLRAQAPKQVMGEGAYMEYVKPKVEELVREMEKE